MKSTITTNTYYRNDMIIKETIVDGDIFEVVEQYLDENGDLIYEYKHDYSPGKLIRMNDAARNKRITKERNKAQYNAKLNKKLEKNRKRG